SVKCVCVTVTWASARRPVSEPVCNRAQTRAKELPKGRVPGSPENPEASPESSRDAGILAGITVHGSKNVHDYCSRQQHFPSTIKQIQPIINT
ncbi:hypothetical protein Tsubulata_031396, partial [Turnera subulata]